jgi:hypothetical protein
MCGCHYAQPILGNGNGGHEHMFVTKDVNMDGECEGLDLQMLDIWTVDALMKNNAEDTMKARLFLLKIITYEFNIYISYCSFSNINTSCMM